jgi:hypothetical protein
LEFTCSEQITFLLSNCGLGDEKIRASDDYLPVRVVVSICSRFELLGVESRDLSQAEKKTIDVKPEQFIKMTIIFTQNGQKMSF